MEPFTLNINGVKTLVSGDFIPSPYEIADLQCKINEGQYTINGQILEITDKKLNIIKINAVTLRKELEKANAVIADLQKEFENIKTEMDLCD